MNSRAISILAGILLLTGGQRLLGQGATAAISGSVLDPSGAAIVGASIAVRNVGTAFTRNLTSDSQGRYFAAELPIGEYEVEALNPGFQTVVRRGIRLTVGSQPLVDLQLPVGQGEETVNVTGELSQVETTSTRREVVWRAAGHRVRTPLHAGKGIRGHGLSGPGTE